jgi:hypothetical protein
MTQLNPETIFIVNGSKIISIVQNQYNLLLKKLVLNI